MVAYVGNALILVQTSTHTVLKSSALIHFNKCWHSLQ